MRQRPSDLLIYALLLLVTLAVLGMLLADWRLVLYPTLLSAGVLIALSRPGRSHRLAVALPAGVTVLLLAGYGALDALSVSDPQVSGLVFGFAPTTALYLFGIAPVLLLVGLAYACTFTTDDTEGTVE
ncbi:hypothetical protein F4561_000408 [Lipingzhangella halophila]|uniref:Uncharacterized protein n=1 Tax=Lipingzhangella halophila TaxID=1783352 RepID=A0A7W7RDE7_9ACTN|nr:hypothetical protein [Lipingzhangella halophila]MBB4929588.1 hypothetical protein [Lipingzhangella halophila]